MRLLELRLEKELSQAEVAKAIGTNQRNIGRWEKGENEPAAFYVVKLAQFFGVTSDYLLGLEDDFGTRSENAAMTERPPHEITDKQLVDVVKLFGVMTELQKARVLGMIIGYLEGEGVNVAKALGY